MLGSDELESESEEERIVDVEMNEKETKITPDKETKRISTSDTKSEPSLPWTTGPIDTWESPHCAQARAYGRVVTDLPFTRLITDKSQALKYQNRKAEMKSTVHWGYRKTLLSEIEFLFQHGKQAATVVYVGAAPGVHINYLASLFPEFKFILYDVKEIETLPARKIEKRQRLFTEQIASEFADKPTLLICDILSSDVYHITADELHASYQKDFELQMKWHSMMKPMYSLFTFRLPWSAGKSKFFDGDLMLPIWGIPTSTECKIAVAREAETREYDHTLFEDQLYYFNTIQRTAVYAHDVVGVGIDYCYDCKAEVEILRCYVESRLTLQPEETVSERIAKISSEISYVLCPTRTLCKPRDFEQKHKIVSKMRKIQSTTKSEFEGILKESKSNYYQPYRKNTREYHKNVKR